jgi:hypothetical protein
LQAYRVYLSRGAHRYSSLLADFHVRNVPTLSVPSLYLFGGGGELLVLTGLLGVLPAYVDFSGLLTCCAFRFCKPAEVWVVSAFPGRCSPEVPISVPFMLASMDCLRFYAFSYCNPAEVWVNISIRVSWSLLTRGACIVNWSTVMYCFGRQSRRTPG